MRLAVVMPAYREAGVLAPFLAGLMESLGDFQPAMVVVDDCSPDDTSLVATRALRGTPGGPHRVLRNDANRGHGPSTLLALRTALADGADWVIAIDGDAQFDPADVRRLLDLARAADADVVEGVRVGRTDAPYRSAVTFLARFLVRQRAGVAPRDPNTPLRVYRAHALYLLLTAVPSDCPIPNLFISAATRRSGARVVEDPVRALARPGAPSSSWGVSFHQAVPSWRFVVFCLRAALHWAMASRPRRAGAPGFGTPEDPAPVGQVRQDT